MSAPRRYVPSGFMAANSSAVVMTVASCAAVLLSDGSTASAETGSKLTVMTQASSRAVILVLIVYPSLCDTYSHLAYSVMLFSTLSLSKSQGFVQAVS